MDQGTVTEFLRATGPDHADQWWPGDDPKHMTYCLAEQIRMDHAGETS